MIRLSLLAALFIACTSTVHAKAALGQPAAPSRGRVVFMGDSITQAWAQAHPLFFSHNRVDRGISGQTTAQMLARFQTDVINLRPAAVHILGGTNDIAENGGPTTLEAIEGNLKSMAKMAQSHHIKIVLGTLLPTTQYPWRPAIKPVPKILALNNWIRAYSRQNGFCLADYYSAMNNGAAGLSNEDSNDGVHPTSQGYDKMERVALPAIECALRK